MNQDELAELLKILAKDLSDTKGQRKIAEQLGKITDKDSAKMANEKLEKLLKSNLMAISEAFIGHRFIELTNELIVVHE